MDSTSTEGFPEVTMNTDSTFSPGTFDEVLTLAGFPVGDLEAIASPKYFMCLCAAYNMDSTALISSGKLDENTFKNLLPEVQTNSLDTSASRLSQQSVTDKQKAQIYALDRFIRSIRLSIDAQENESKADILSSLRNTRGYILKIEDEIAESRKLHTQSVIHNKKHSYMVNELRLQLFESYIEADIHHREQHLKQLNKIEELERELSKQAKKDEVLKIQLAREKLMRLLCF
ncbi:hypothetical protein C8J55DRAFT_489538 [Lentinula edodes]|uniref:Uncharacterized protein n=1 Tax=Lentinula lateritia TaxID=40482 RepID=A0A9W9AB30_9AGAR|nr:hypothetical protein C8J55DRAFT_489538 [Lentinula edodes]